MRAGRGDDLEQYTSKCTCRKGSRSVAWHGIHYRSIRHLDLYVVMILDVGMGTRYIIEQKCT